MKKVLSLLLVFVALTSTSFSQEKVKYDRSEWEKKVKEELRLTADQVEKFNALNKEYDGRIQTLLNDASLSKESQKERKMALKKEKDEKFMSILSAEQQAKYREMIDKKKKVAKSPA